MKLGLETHGFPKMFVRQPFGTCCVLCPGVRAWFAAGGGLQPPLHTSQNTPSTELLNIHKILDISQPGWSQTSLIVNGLVSTPCFSIFLGALISVTNACWDNSRALICVNLRYFGKTVFSGNFHRVHILDLIWIPWLCWQGMSKPVPTASKSRPSPYAPSLWLATNRGKQKESFQSYLNVFILPLSQLSFSI